MKLEDFMKKVEIEYFSYSDNFITDKQKEKIEEVFNNFVSLKDKQREAEISYILALKKYYLSISLYRYSNEVNINIYSGETKNNNRYKYNDIFYDKFEDINFEDKRLNIYGLDTNLTEENFQKKSLMGIIPYMRLSNNGIKKYSVYSNSQINDKLFPKFSEHFKKDIQNFTSNFLKKVVGIKNKLTDKHLAYIIGVIDNRDRDNNQNRLFLYYDFSSRDFAIGRVATYDNSYNLIDEERLIQFSRYSFDSYIDFGLFNLDELSISFDNYLKLVNKDIDIENQSINKKDILSYHTKLLLAEKKEEREKAIREMKNKKYEENIAKITEDNPMIKNSISFYKHKMEYNGIIFDSNKLIDFKTYLKGIHIDQITDFNDILNTMLINIGLRFVCNNNLYELPYELRHKLGYGISYVNTGLLNKNTFKFMLDGKTITLTSKNNFNYVNDIRINKHEVYEVLLHIICYKDNKEYNKFLNVVNKCSLKFHNAISNNLKKDYIVDYSSPRINLEFKVTRNKNLNYLKVGDKLYQIKDSNRLIDFKPYNKKDLINLLISSVHLEITDLPEIFKEAEQQYKKALEKSKKLLEKTLKILNAKEETLDINNSKEKGYIIKGQSGKEYFVIEPKEASSTNFKIYDITNRNNPDYICIVNKTRAGYVGKDALVSRLYALANDTLIAKEVSTLKV